MRRATARITKPAPSISPGASTYPPNEGGWTPDGKGGGAGALVGADMVCGFYADSGRRSSGAVRLRVIYEVPVAAISFVFFWALEAARLGSKQRRQRAS